MILVFFFYSEELSKKLDIDWLTSQEDLAKLWVLDKLDREAAWGNLVALLTEICDVTGTVPEDWQLPRTCCLRPIRAGEVRLTREDTREQLFFNEGQNKAYCELPTHYWNVKFRFASQVPDRSSIGTSLLHWLIANQCLMPIYFDTFHGLWNSLKNSTKHAGKFSGQKIGFMWKQVLAFLTIANQNYGPFKSGVWFTEKQRAAQRWYRQNSELSESFLRVAEKWAKKRGVGFTSAAELKDLFDQVPRIKTFNEKGDLLKLMRFLSIEDAWQYWRLDIWGVKPVLEMMAEEALDNPSSVRITTETGATGGGSAGDTEKNAAAAAKTIFKVPKYITDLLVDSMEVFSVATKFHRVFYEHRASRVKSIDAARKDNARLVDGGWRKEYSETTRNVMYDVDCLVQMGVPDSVGARSQFLSAMSFDYLVTLLADRYDTTIFYLHCYPAKFRLYYAQSGIEDAERIERERMIVRRRVFLQDWLWLKEAEGEARTSPAMAALLKDIFWGRWSFNRLAMCQNELECVEGVTTSWEHTVQGVTDCWGDSRGAEEVHKALRGQSRNNFNGTMGKSRILRTAIDTGVPERRDMKIVEVTDAEIAKRWREIQSTSIDSWFRCDPDTLPPELKGILSANAVFESPNGKSYTKCASAWMWLRSWFESFKQQGVTVESGKWARLIPGSQILRRMNGAGSPMLVLSTLPYSLFVNDVAETQGNDGRFIWTMRTDERAFHEFFVTAPEDWVLHEVEVVYSEGAGQVLRSAGPPRRTWEAALLAGIPFEIAHMAYIAQIISIDLPDSNDPVALRTALLEGVFEDEMLRQRCHEAFVERCKKKDGEVEFDEDLADILDTVLDGDVANEGEVRTLAGMIKKETARRMTNLRDEVRRSKVKAKLARIARRTKKPRAKGKAKATAAAQAGAAPGPPQAPEPPAPPAAADGATDRVDTAHAASVNRGPVVYRTPAAVFSIILPPEMKGYLKMDQKCWVAKHVGIGENLLRSSFGPRSGKTRLEAAKKLVDDAWEVAGRDRPPECAWPSDDALPDVFFEDRVPGH